MSTGELTKEDGSLDVDAANELFNEYDKKYREDNPAEDPKADEKASEDQPTQPEQPVAENNSGSDEKAADDNPSSDDDWRATSDIRELVESLGLSDEDLGQFSDADDFGRHVSIFDRQLRKTGEDALLKASQPRENVEPAPEKPEEKEAVLRDEKGRFVKRESYKPALDKEEFDGDLVAEFEKMSEHYESRITELESIVLGNHQSILQERNERFMNQFDSYVDKLGNEDLFGKSSDIKPDTDEWTNRSKLFDAMGQLMAGMNEKGMKDSMSSSLVKRAFSQEFPDALTKEQSQTRKKQAKAQSKKKLGGGNAKPSLGEESVWNGDPSRDPFLIAAYREMSQQNE